MSMRIRAAAVVGICALALAGAAAGQAALRPDTPPLLFWNAEQQLAWYPHMETIYPVRVVRRGEHVHALAPAARPIQMHAFTWAGRSWALDEFMTAYRISGLIVLKDGKVALEHYALGRKPEERWTSFSVAKSVTSLLAGAAIADGRLALHDQVVRLVPELKGSAYDGVTVSQLLTMSSGVKWDETYTDPNSDIARWAAISDKDPDAVFSYLKGLPRAHAPGSTWHYNTAETNLAGVLVSRAAGKPLADYLSEKIWRPYGMEADGVWMLDHAGREIAGCCLSATLRDFARIGQFALENGVADGKAIEPPEWIAQSTRVQIANDQPPPAGYGYFWWIGRDSYQASGIFGQAIVVYPQDRVVIAVNSAFREPDSPKQFAALEVLEEALRDAAVAAGR